MSHETEHASKPFANPLGIMAGLVVLWVVAGGLVWLLLKVFLPSGEGG